MALIRGAGGWIGGVAIVQVRVVDRIRGTCVGCQNRWRTHKVSMMAGNARAVHHAERGCHGGLVPNRGIS